MVDNIKQAGHFVRLRGLPYSATEDDVRDFFHGLKVVDILFVNMPDGRPAGECFCEFERADDVSEAMKKNQQCMGNRYIEIFMVGEVEMDRIMRKRHLRKVGANVGILRMRGLPFSCKKEDITTFFKDYKVEEVVFGKELGEWGRPTGEAYVRFDSKQEAEQALQLNGQHIGKRYLELFRADMDAFDQFKSRMTCSAVPLNSLRGPPADSWSGGGYQYGVDYGAGYGGIGGYLPAGGYNGGLSAGGPLPCNNNRQAPGYRYSPYEFYGRDGPPNQGGGGAGPRAGGEFISPTKVQLRGIPYRITAKEIEDFFAPLRCAEIKLGYYEDGRSTGDAIVEFLTMTEAREAQQQKDHQSIGNRYIEIFSSNQMKIPYGAYYRTVGGSAPGTAQAPTPLSAAIGYQWYGNSYPQPY